MTRALTDILKDSKRFYGQLYINNFLMFSLKEHNTRKTTTYHNYCKRPKTVKGKQF